MLKIRINPKYTKTYKTEKNLDIALEKLGFPDDLHFVLTEIDERFTAVFCNAYHVENGAWIGHIAHSGFKVVG